MAFDNSHNCKEHWDTKTDACSKCGVSDPIKKNGGRSLVFGGTIVLLLTVALVSYPYLFSDSEIQKSNDKAIEISTDSLSNKQINKTDTLREDPTNKIPSF